MNNPAQQIIEAIQILVDNAMKKTTNINGGIITSINNDGRYSVLVKGKTNILKAYPRTRSLSVGDTVQVVTPQGQNSQAFILPCSFNVIKENLNIVDETINSTSTPQNDIYGIGLCINDVNNEQIGYIRAVSLSTGYDGIEILTTKNINNTDYENKIGLFIDKSGNNLIEISDPSAWRTALGI